MKLEYKLQNILMGGGIYAIGDSIAALIANEFSLLRFVGILIIGATIYALEISNYFRWIDKKVVERGSWIASLKRASLAMLYFNPLWIARHILFIKLLTKTHSEIGINLIAVGAISFLVNIPISLFSNYIIQNKIGFRYRFLASAIFSGLMAIYYSMSEIWF